MKRKVGERANILFDDIDLKILETLNNSDDGLKVLTITNKLGMKHKNLKPESS